MCKHKCCCNRYCPCCGRRMDGSDDPWPWLPRWWEYPTNPTWTGEVTIPDSTTTTSGTTGTPDGTTYTYSVKWTNG